MSGVLAMTLEEAVRYRLRWLNRRLADLREMNPIPREEFNDVVVRQGVLAAVLAEAGLPEERL